jgi:DNA (cytosine-5)-methyltransferase 1
VYPRWRECPHQLQSLRSLHLFAGAGGGILADLLLGHRPIGAVEIRKHCQSVLRQRIADGVLPWLPIFSDVREFDGRPWRGVVDILNGSFPCQPFSSASRGRRVAVDLWPEQRRITGECRPQYVVAENVQRDPIEGAAWDLYADGYRAAFCELSAADLGAPHQRRRWWLVAANADRDWELRRPLHAQAVACSSSNAPLDWWANDREAHRVHDGVAPRMVRLSALGNGVVPSVEAAAWLLLRPLVDQ